ncbi:MAG: TIGR02147 family protein [Deltaproteobacteria bacterium]|nr:MAG: TIGR02147 family protein [Deltaproteobacteria bacterium]
MLTFMPMLSIYHYLDYRHFLRDYYEDQKKAKGSAFSYRSFARFAGLSSPNFLKLVIEGKRNLGLKGITQFSKALHLKSQEARYFHDLVQFNQATSDKERNLWYQKLATSRQYREIKEIEEGYFTYFSRWYYPAIREMVLVPHFKENPAWIANRLKPRISKKEAMAALELLLKLGFLKRDDAGKLIQSDRNITTAREVQSLAIRNYHRQMMTQAMDSIENTVREKRDISSLTIALSPEKFEEAKRRIQEFRRELNVLLSDESSEKMKNIFQINFQLFPLTEGL